MRAPPDLAALEGYLAAALRRPEPITGDAAATAEAAAHLTGNDRLTPAEQADIYRRQFWLRHVDCLAEDYPGLQRLLGDEGFEAFARAYLIAHPPVKFSLRDLGERIAAFAEIYPGFAPEVRDAALEMVRYELLFVDLFDAAEPPALDPTKVQALAPEAWETARIVLSPLLVLRRLAYPVHRYRVAVRTDDATPELSPEAVHLALFRQDLLIRYEELAPEAFALLEALGRGEALVPACDALAQGLAPEAAEALAAKVGPWFQEWTARRWIIDVG